MTSTSTKKGTIDFLWEWAENNGDWCKLLTSKLTSTENTLSVADRKEVFNYFLQSIKLHSGLPPLNISKPAYAPNRKNVKLASLSNVIGVNRLAANQTISFGDNLTVVFGENGTGKTGYSRILKTLGFSYDTNNKILSNIFRTNIAKSAVINFSTDGKTESFNWDGTNRNVDLQSIAVFNNNCVKISLDDRQLIVSPLGFHLFRLAISEIQELEQLLIAERAKFPTALACYESLNQGSPQQIYVNGLSAVSTEEKLNELSNFTQEHEQELKTTETELAGMNKALLDSDIQGLTVCIRELEQVILKIQAAQKILTGQTWEELIKLNLQISELEKESQKGIKEIAETNGIKFYETNEFSNFIQSAENYIKIIGKENYPSQDDACIYCKQKLEVSAKELLANYRTLLNDKTQETLAKVRSQKQNLISSATSIDSHLAFHQPSFGIDENQTIVQPIEVKNYNQILDRLKNIFISGQVTEGATFDLDYDHYIQFFAKKKDSLTNYLDRKKITLSDLSTKEADLRRKISELKDRRLLSTKIEEVKKAIANHKTIAILNKNSGSFTTNALSRKTTEAREVLVKENFETVFKKELNSFRKGHINIDLNFGTNRGTSQISHRIKSYLLADILSEGEQKAIALAEFLTELQLDNIKAPVIFDDPVNSLDHHIIDDVARRLMKLSNERQVIVFTHSVLLFNSFLYFAKQPAYKTFACKFYNSKNEFAETGFIHDGEEEINSPASYIKKINSLIKNTPKDRQEADIAEDGYGYLRSAIELLVEYEIFHGTVKRYQKNIALTQFAKVKGDLLNTYKESINELFERCCSFIKGHSNPEEIYVDPTLAGLTADFGEFEKIRNVFLSKN